MPESSTGTARPRSVIGLWKQSLERGEAFWIGALSFNTANNLVKLGDAYGGVPSGNIMVRPPADYSVVGSTAFDNYTSINSAPDGIFYIRESASGNQMVFDGAALTTKSRDEWDHLNLRFKEGSTNFYGILTNGANHLMKVVRANISGKVGPAIGFYVPNNARVVTNDAGQPTDSRTVGGRPAGDTAAAIATFAITAVGHLARYQNSVVYAGYRSYNPDESTTLTQWYPNFAAFSSPMTSEFGPYEVSADATIQVGESVNDPITGCCVNSTDSDSVGIKGQLVFFTPKTVQIFDGLPPVPGDETPNNFQSVGLNEFGCIAPRSIAPTPYGVVWLGTDGVVRLLPKSGHPVDIGRAIQPALERLNPRQNSIAAGIFYKGFYLLSVPEHSQTFCSTQYWADLRYLQLGNRDGGAAWSGPHRGQLISCFAVSRDMTGNYELIGGTSRGSEVYQLFRDDIPTDPQNEMTPDDMQGAGADIPIRTAALSNPLDMGDAHIKHEVQTVKLGVKTDTTTTIELSVSVESVDTDGQLAPFQTTFSEVVSVPISGVINSQFRTKPNEFFKLIEKPIGERLDGRVVTVGFVEKPTTGVSKDAKVGFTDLQLTYRDSPRSR